LGSERTGREKTAKAWDIGKKPKSPSIGKNPKNEVYARSEKRRGRSSRREAGSEQ